MWLHRFSGHYFEPDGRRPTAKDHRESFKAYLANLKKLGAEHYIQMLTELRLAAYQDKLAAMRVRYGD
ncbi:hypothetical protein N836_13660 [Leptolyngbya sp. Heron Island J]|nr:hypothetical protein N836_13660 [Leptolyngbya sp. Heron Island J]